jgi:hypothetical protein
MKRLREPDDPTVLAEVLEDIRNTTREEWLEILRKYPDFDEAWVLPVDEDVPAPNGHTPDGQSVANGSREAV